MFGWMVPGGTRVAHAVDGVDDFLHRLIVRTNDSGDTMPRDPTPKGEPQ